MLVLSRRQGQKIVFPKLGILVEMLRVSGNSVRVGIEAPSDVAVLREEVAQREGATEAATALVQPGNASHALRNQLSTAKAALRLLRKQLEVAQHDAAQKTLDQLAAQLAAIEQELLAPARPAVTKVDMKPFRALIVEDDKNECELLAASRA